MLFVLVISLFVNFTHCAKILCVFVSPITSHQMIGQPIWRELSLRGHDVTVITPNPLRDPALINLTEIDIGSIKETYNSIINSYVTTSKTSPWLLAVAYYPVNSYVMQTAFKHPKVKEFLEDKSNKFDVVLIEFVHDLLLGFGGRYKCPMVGISPHYANINSHFALGNPSHPIAAPEIQLRYTNNLDLFQRVESVLYSIFLRFLYKCIVLPIDTIMARQYFGSEINLSDLERNVSILLTNTHPLIHGVRPNMPTVIELGKIEATIKEEVVPEDLQAFLDSAMEGVIYFSLGSLMKASHVFGERFDIIIETLEELPQKVLWKLDDEVLPRQNNKTMVKSWVPQKKVLSHPNVKLFIMQGGPQSMQEALFNRVPIVAMPMQFDQFAISKRMADFGIGKVLDPEYITKQKFKETLKDVIKNPEYKRKVDELAELIDDQPMGGLEKAIWWIEYVIRHRGAKHLRSPEIYIPFYKYYFIDVILTVSLVILILYKIKNKFVSYLFVKLERQDRYNK